MDANMIIKRLQEVGIKAELTEKKGRKSLILGEGNVRPVVYFDNYNRDEEMVDFVVNNYERLTDKGKTYQGCLTDIFNYDLIKDQLTIRVRPTSYDVTGKCYEKLYDLYMIAAIRIGGDAVTEVGTELLEQWGKSKFQVLIDAVENSKDSYKVETMAQVMSEMMEMDIPEDAFLPAYVISTAEKIEGAGVLFYMSYFKDLADKLNADLIIIPSSIHEVLVVSADELDEKKADAMIKETNQEQVLPEERLADHCYRFNRKSGMIEWGN